MVEREEEGQHVDAIHIDQCFEDGNVVLLGRQLVEELLDAPKDVLAEVMFLVFDLLGLDEVEDEVELLFIQLIFLHIYTYHYIVSQMIHFRTGMGKQSEEEGRWPIQRFRIERILSHFISQ